MHERWSENVLTEATVDSVGRLHTNFRMSTFTHTGKFDIEMQHRVKVKGKDIPVTGHGGP
jgi:hypothetical protein